MQSVTPINHVLVEINKAFEDEISLCGGNLKLFLDTSYEKSQHVLCTGRIHALPKHPKTALEKRICRLLEEGDEVVFSYLVVADIEHIPTEGYFTQISHPEETKMFRYQNGKQDTITKVCVPTTTGGRQWVGVLTNKWGDWVDGTQGNESDVDRWLSQFSLSQPDRYKFKNLLPIDGKDVWKVSLDEIFAKRTKSGKLIPVGDRLLLKPIDIDISAQIGIMKGISIPKNHIQTRYYDRAKILHEYEPLGIEKGDVVAFEPNYVEKYNFFGDEYFILKPYRASGIWETSKLKVAS